MLVFQVAAFRMRKSINMLCCKDQSRNTILLMTMRPDSGIHGRFSGGTIKAAEMNTTVARGTVRGASVLIF